MNQQTNTLDQTAAQEEEVQSVHAEQIKTLHESELLWVGGGSGTVIF